MPINLPVHSLMCLFMGLPHLSSELAARCIVYSFDKIYFLLFDLLLQISWNAPAIDVRMVAHVTIRGRDSIHAVVHKGTVGITAKRVRKIKSPGRMR